MGIKPEELLPVPDESQHDRLERNEADKDEALDNATEMDDDSADQPEPREENLDPIAGLDQ